MDFPIKITVDAGGAVTGSNKAIQALKRLGYQANKTESSVHKLSKSLSSVKIATLAFTASLVLVARSIFKTYNEYTRLRVAVDTLEGSMADGNKKWNELLDFAEKTPYTMSEVVGMFKQLKAYGLDPTTQAMTDLGDAAAILGSDKLPSLARALGQISSVGKLTAEDLNQLTDAGININEWLSQSFNTNKGGIDTINKLIESGSIKMKSIIDSLYNYIRSKFGGGMARLLDTLGGQWDRFINILQTLKDKLLSSGIGDYIKTLLDRFNDWFGTLNDADFTTFSDRIINTFQSIAVNVAFYLSEMKDSFTDFMNEVEKAGGLGNYAGNKMEEMKDAAVNEIKNVADESLGTATKTAIGTGALSLLGWGGISLLNRGAIDKKLSEAVDYMKGFFDRYFGSNTDFLGNKVDEKPLYKSAKKTESVWKRTFTNIGKHGKNVFKNVSKYALPVTIPFVVGYDTTTAIMNLMEENKALKEPGYKPKTNKLLSPFILNWGADMLSTELASDAEPMAGVNARIDNYYRIRAAAAAKEKNLTDKLQAAAATEEKNLTDKLKEEITLTSDEMDFMLKHGVSMERAQAKPELARRLYEAFRREPREATTIESKETPTERIIDIDLLNKSNKLIEYTNSLLSSKDRRVNEINQKYGDMVVNITKMRDAFKGVGEEELSRLEQEMPGITDKIKYLQSDKIMVDLRKRQSEELNADLQSNLDSIEQSLKTELELYTETYNKQLEVLKEADDKGLISHKKYLEDKAKLDEEYNANLSKLTNDTAYITETVWKNATFRMTNAAESFFFNAMKGKYTDLKETFFDIIRSMISEWTSAQLRMAVFGKSGTGGLVGGLISVFQGIAGSFSGKGEATTAATATNATAKMSPVAQRIASTYKHSGGKILSTGQQRSLGTALYLHNGGYLKPGEVNTVLKRGETVIPAGQRPGNKVNVNVYNAPGTEATVTQKDTEEGVSLDIVIDMIEDRIAQNVSSNRGSLGNTMQNVYGLNRSFSMVR